MNISLVYTTTEYQNQTALQLDEVGYTVNQTFSISSPWFASINRDKPDLLVISIDTPDNDLYQQLTLLQENKKCPVIVLCHTHDHLIVEKTIFAGADSCVIGKLTAQRIQNVIETTMARHKVNQRISAKVLELSQEVESLEARLSDRKYIDHAKVLLMTSYNMDETDAYNAMRNMAMETGNKLGEVARNLISMSKILT